jgi:hypothetical protein
MSHHGSSPFDGDGPFQNEAQEELRRLMKLDRSNLTRELLDTTGFIGATGQFPEGKLTKTDEGAIHFAIGSKGDKVILDFGKPVHWVGMSAQQAADLASSLMKAARRVGRKTGVTVTVTLGSN